jgi:hypothetical protein
MAEGFDVPIIETIEKWSEIKLEDGAVLRIKPNVLSVIRVTDQYDPDGNPVYALRSSQVMTVVSAPERYRKGGKPTQVQ